MAEPELPAPGRRVFLIYVLPALAGALTLASAVAAAQPGKVRLPTPDGLIPCKDNDLVVSAEKRVAASLHAEYLACFTSNDKTPLQGASKTLLVAAEHAVAMSAPGGPFSLQDLDTLLSQDRARWQNFDPLSERFREDYVARVNSLLEETTHVSMESVNPTLVSIERHDANSYAVTSIREYVMSAGGERLRSVKATAVAMVLQGTQLVRLEILREIRGPSDVDEARTQIAAWSRAVSG